MANKKINFKYRKEAGSMPLSVSFKYQCSFSN